MPGARPQISRRCLGPFRGSRGLVHLGCMRMCASQPPCSMPAAARVARTPHRVRAPVEELQVECELRVGCRARLRRGAAVRVPVAVLRPRVHQRTLAARHLCHDWEGECRRLQMVTCSALAPSTFNLPALADRSALPATRAPAALAQQPSCSFSVQSAVLCPLPALETKPYAGSYARTDCSHVLSARPLLPA